MVDINSSNAHSYMQQMISKLEPNEIYLLPRQDLYYNSKKAEVVRLEDLTHGTYITVHGHKLNAVYRMLIDESDEGKLLHIWGNGLSNGFVGPLEALASYEIKEKGFPRFKKSYHVFEEGVLRVGRAATFPYFDFNLKGEVPIPLSIENHATRWEDVIDLIIIHPPIHKGR